MFGSRFFRKMRVLTISAATAAVVGWSSIACAAAFQVGDQGKEVAEIQAQLVEVGYDVSADGDFGPATKEAIKSFQKSQGLEVDGIVGPSTYYALMGRSMPVVSRGNNYASRRMISTAMGFLGTPYVWGGTSPSGFDCSCFVQYIYATAGISVPRTADVQFDVGEPVSIDSLRPGDAVFFSTYEPGPSHVGIYIGDGNFIHASSVCGVTITPLHKEYYINRYLGARRMS